MKKALALFWQICYESRTSWPAAARTIPPAKPPTPGTPPRPATWSTPWKPAAPARRWPPRRGWEFTSVTAQADALMEVAAGTSDAAIIDLLMAGAMIGEGTSYPDLVYDTEGLTTEEYGIGCRKGSDLAAYINTVLAESYADGSMAEIAATYGIEDALVEQPAAEEFTPAESDSDVAYIQEKGTLIVGITEFEPMDYQDAGGDWIGFDADMAKLVAEKLGVEIEFIVIDWNNKIMELDSKNIDVVWNGMTLTDEVTSSMECTNPYVNNAQGVVTKAQ